MKLNPSQRARIKETKKQIAFLEKQQTNEFNILCKNLDIDKNSNFAEILFDYVYNNLGTLKDLED